VEHPSDNTGYNGTMGKGKRGINIFGNVELKAKD